MGFEAYCRNETQMSATRDMVCGRGARKRVYIPGENPHIEESSLPYPVNEVDLVAHIRAEGEGARYSAILEETSGKLGVYSELVQCSIRSVADGVFLLEAFPGAGKTTVTAAVDQFLCLVSDGKVKILVVAGQHAALDALNGNFTKRLQSSVPDLSKKVGKRSHTDSSAQPACYPLLLRAYGNDHEEIMKFARLVRTGFKSSPRPNSICHLLLQVLGAGPYRLPEFSKPELTELATSVKDDEREGFRKLRQFVAGDLSWDEANETQVTRSLEGLEKPGDGLHPLILSGDPGQFGPFIRDYRKHIFREFMITSSLHTIKTAGYLVFLLNTQHRAVDGQFDVLYQNFYPDFKSIKSHPSRHPENHPDAQRVEASIVADFPGLEASPADRILPIFVPVPNSVCEWNGKSRYSLLQTKAAAYVVKKLVNCGVELAEIMVIGAYRAEVVELRRVLPRGVLVTSADAVQGQERPYVLFVFATTKQAGAGFTQDPRRLCVLMSRHKNFLALIGDIDTVDHENFVPANKDDVRIYLVNIHKYFVVNKRVGPQRKPRRLYKMQQRFRCPSRPMCALFTTKRKINWWHGLMKCRHR